jgi:small subunit ribosomal protein S4
LARYRGPANKLFRNYGVKDLSAKKLVSSMTQYASGQHGQNRKKPSEYALQLKEKQKIRLTYLVSEKQFHRYYVKASRKNGVTGTLLLQYLECRLDNVLFRAGFAVTRRQSRQFVKHGHVLVNDKKVDIPSYILKEGDIITIREKSSDLFKLMIEMIDQAQSPSWISVDTAAQVIKVDRLPEREEIDPDFKEQLIIEFYSK